MCYDQSFSCYCTVWWRVAGKISCICPFDSGAGAFCERRCSAVRRWGTRVRLQSQLWGLETYLTNTDERLDLTLTWHSWLETWLRLDTDDSKVLAFLSFYYSECKWVHGIYSNNYPSQGHLNLMLGPGAERFCRPSIPSIYRVSFFNFFFNM